MFIQDAVHGYITLDEMETELLGTRVFQRLRRIRQLGFTNLIYPSTTHTRFEHSLGACYLAGKFADGLDLEGDKRRYLRAAALLHDLGHGPFSHTSETVMEKHGHSHEDFSEKRILEPPVSEILSGAGLNPERVVQLIRGKTELGQVIAGDIDVDRMDYLMRDAHYSGVAHGAIDASTIIRAAEFRDGNLVFNGKFKQALEGVLTARYLMIPTVYLHRSVVRAEKMMERGLDAMIEAGELEAAELAEMDDIDMKYRMRHTDVERARYLNELLDTRDVFKTALRWDEEDISRDGLRELATNITDEQRIEEKIADAAGMDVKEVLVNKPHIPKSRGIAVSVWHRGERKPLSEISQLTKAVYSSEWDQTALEVYGPRDKQHTLHEAAKEVLSEYKGLLNKYLRPEK